MRFDDRTLLTLSRLHFDVKGGGLNRPCSQFVEIAANGPIALAGEGF